MSRILVAEDEARIASFIGKGLQAAGHAVTVVADGQRPPWTRPGRPRPDRARHRAAAGWTASRSCATCARAHAPDPRHHPDRPGLGRVTRWPAGGWRRRLHGQAVPVRRATGPHPAPPAGRATGPRADHATGLRWTWSLDLRSRRAARRRPRGGSVGSRVYLAETFLRNPGSGAVAPAVAQSHVWGYDFDPGSNVVDVYVRYLRQKARRPAASRRCAGPLTAGGGVRSRFLTSA